MADEQFLDNRLIFDFFANKIIQHPVEFIVLAINPVINKVKHIFHIIVL